MNNEFIGKKYNEVWHLCLKSKKDNVPLIVENIGITFPNPYISLYRENHNMFVIEYVISGVEHLSVDEREFTLTKGDLVILEPKVKHSYHSDKKDPVTKKWINFISEDFERMYHQLGLRNKIVFKNTNAEHYFDVLLSIAETSHYTDDICYDVASTLYSLIFEVAKKESLKENKKVSEVAKIIKERIDNAIFKKVNLDTICEITYYSKKQITREFKKYYGYTPYNYLITIKIDMAKRLLKSTNLSIKQIAYKLCFDNQHYFSKAFKKKTNMSPLEYRNNKK